MREACESFFEWLKEADEDSDDDDSSSDEEEKTEAKEVKSGLTEAQNKQKELIKKAQEK